MRMNNSRPVNQKIKNILHPFFLLKRVNAGTPQYRLGLWRRTFETNEYKTNFDPPLEEQWKRSIQATEDSVIDRVLSKSYISILSDENKENIVAGLREILTRGSGKIWIDEAGGVFEYPYQTDLVISRIAVCENMPTDELHAPGGNEEETLSHLMLLLANPQFEINCIAPRPRFVFEALSAMEATQWTLQVKVNGKRGLLHFNFSTFSVIPVSSKGQPLDVKIRDTAEPT